MANYLSYKNIAKINAISCIILTMENNFASEGKRFKTLAAVMVFLADNNRILLQKRQNTGFSDGKWDFAASGHVDENETMKESAIRELREEAGVIAEDIEFMGLIHELGEDNRPRFLGAFRVTKWRGEPHIQEPEKCSELKWFELDNLPKDIIKSRRIVLENLKSPGLYLECGWEQPNED